MTPAELQTSSQSHPVCTEGTEPLEVTCYVRGDVSAPVRRQIESVESRLRALAETDRVEAVEFEQWPRRISGDFRPGSKPPRVQLVDKLERWAQRHGYSLRPAIRRREVPSSLVGPDRSYSEICVPVVMLEIEVAADESDSLAGVVPYTINYGTEEATTYTVDDWLSAIEQSTAPTASPSLDTGRTTTADSD